jgi:hypothetical protein
LPKAASLAAHLAERLAATKAVSLADRMAGNLAVQWEQMSAACWAGW